jgi:hypothetical protein
MTERKEPAPPAGAVEGEYVGRPDLIATLAKWGLKTTMRTMDRKHQERQGPPRIVIGRRILYKIGDLREWLEQHREGGRQPRGGRKTARGSKK